jgi:hypothetical protein
MRWTKISAKFQVDSVKHTKHGSTVEMSPVTAGEADRSFWESTPSGKLEMEIVRRDVAAGFRPGDVYLLHFERVTEDES